MTPSVMYDDNVGNTTESTPQLLVTRSTAEITVAAIVLLCIILTSMIGNSAVIYAIFKNAQLRDHVSNLFIMNLSLTDLTTASVVMCTSLVTLIGDVTDVNIVWCNFACAANYCLIIVSMMTLAFISIDRYIAVIHSLKYQMLMTSSRIYMMIGYSWFQGVAFAVVPVVLHWNHYDYWEVICAVDWSHETAVYYVIIACIVCFLIPGGTMVFCYTNVIRQAKKCSAIQAMPTNSYKLEPAADGHKTDSTHKQRRVTSRMTKTITSLLIVVILFFIFMTPFCVTKFLKVVMTHPSAVPPYANLTAAFFAYLSSVVNPFVYGIFRADFRNAYKRMFNQISCCQYRYSYDDSYGSNSTTRRNSMMPKSSPPANANNTSDKSTRVVVKHAAKVFTQKSSQCTTSTSTNTHTNTNTNTKTKAWSSTRTLQVWLHQMHSTAIHDQQQVPIVPKLTQTVADSNT